MKTERLKYAYIMKYVTLVLTVAFVVLIMLYTSGSNKPFEDVEQAVSSSLDQDGLEKQSGASFKREFGLTEADYAGVMYYASGFSMSAEEVLLIRVHSESQAAEVVEAIEARLEARKNDFEGYMPEAVKLIEDAKKSVRGKDIFFAVSPKADEYLDIFAKSL